MSSRTCRLAVLVWAAAASAWTAEPDLRVSDNGRFLVDRDTAAPFCWMGDTGWSLFGRYTPAEAETYLTDRARKKFNVIQTFFSAGWMTKDTAGHSIFLNGDATQPNPQYLTHVDAVLDAAESHGLYVCLGIGEVIRSDSPWYVATTAKGYEYGRIMGSHFRNRTSLIWSLGQDFDPVTDGLDYRPVIRAVAEGVADGVNGVNAFDGAADYTTTLQTYHPSTRSAKWFHADAWLDFNMIQTWKHVPNVPANVTSDYALTPPKPTVHAEGCYETATADNDLLVTPHVARYQAYWAVFAGGMHTYGHSRIWGHSSGWQAALEAAGGVSMQHLRALQESRPILSRIPDQSVITSTKGATSDGSFRTAVRASDRSYVFVYTTRGDGFTVDMGKVSGSTANAWWFNPRDGTCYDGANAQTTLPFGSYGTGGTRTFDPPGPSGNDLDWVLVLDDAAQGFPPPGTVAAGARIAMSTAAIAATCECGQDAPDASFQVWNGGTGTLLYKLVETSSKLAVSPATGASAGAADKKTHTISFTTADLAPGTYERTISVEDNGSGAVNGPLTLNVTITVTEPVPAAPSGLAASPVSATEVRLTWTDLPNETRYMLRKSLDGVDWYAFEAVYPTANVTAYTDAGLSPNTVYYYKVRGTNDGGMGPYGAPVSVRTPPEAPPPIAKGSMWKYRPGTAEASTPPEAWHALEFDDRDWALGNTPIGFSTDAAEGPFGTTLGDMRYFYTCVFLRRTFVVEEPALVSAVHLRSAYDDGFILWLNGQEAMRANVVGAPGSFVAYNQTGPPDSIEPVVVSNALAGAGLMPLRAGTNVVAVQVFNYMANSSDLVFDLELALVRCSLPVADDADRDALPDDWEQAAFGRLDTPGGEAAADPDGDGQSNLEEYIAGTDPMGKSDWLGVAAALVSGHIAVSCPTVAAAGPGYEGLSRHYALESAASPHGGEGWTVVPGYENILGAGQTLTHMPAMNENSRLYRARIWLEGQ